MTIENSPEKWPESDCLSANSRSGVYMPPKLRALFSASLPAVMFFSPPTSAEETDLDRYVHAPDEAYEFELMQTDSHEDITYHAIKMVSQTWLSEDEVDKPTWWHWLNLYVPENPKSEVALLVISGGSTRSDHPRDPDQTFLDTALATGNVVAELRMVPNQPLIFHNDGKERFEDDLVAYGWDKYLRSGESKWLARLPMTKSAIRGMDTTIEFLSQPEGGEISIEKFVVAGASKRGWTTWMTAAVDNRVTAIAPIVIDMLNSVPSFEHHFASYGEYSPAVGDYVRHGIMNWQGTPEYEKLLSIVDPYHYRQRLTLPKLMINSAGDQFFLPDSSRFYFEDLIGPKYLCYVANTDHSLKGSDAAQTLAAWQHKISSGLPLPIFDWSIDWEKGSIRVESEDTPKNLTLWQAHNPDARDFRLETIGPAWKASEVTLDSNGAGEFFVEEPDEGWTAFFLEVAYPLGDFPAPFKITTGVAVVPDTRPFEERLNEVKQKVSR